MEPRSCAPSVVVHPSRVPDIGHVRTCVRFLPCDIDHIGFVGLYVAPMSDWFDIMGATTRKG